MSVQQPPTEGYIVMTRNEWPVHFHTTLDSAAFAVASDPSMKSCWHVAVDVLEDMEFVPAVCHTIRPKTAS